MTEHILYVKVWIIPQYDEGKDLEVRTGNRHVTPIKVGDVINFNHRVRRRVKDVRRYLSLGAMAEREDLTRVLPSLDQGRVLTTLRSIYSPDQEKNGVYVFELESILAA